MTRQFRPRGFVGGGFAARWFAPTRAGARAGWAARAALLLACGCALALPGRVQAQSRLDELERRLFAPPPASREPGFLGLSADNRRGFPGAVVVAVHRGGPAEAAGLREGDALLAVNGQLLRSLDDLSDMLAEMTAGDRVAFTISREGRREIVYVTLGRRPSGVVAARPPVRPAPDEPTLPETGGEGALPRGATAAAPVDTASPVDKLGLRLRAIDEETRRTFGLPSRRGVLIEGVLVGSPAERATLPLGAVIVAIDERRVDSPDEVRAALADGKPGETVELTIHQDERVLRVALQIPALEPTRAADTARAADTLPGPVVAPPRVEAPTPGENAALRAEVARLRDEVELLLRRLADLEAKVGGGK